MHSASHYGLDYVGYHNEDALNCFTNEGLGDARANFVMDYETQSKFTVGDVEPWMWNRAKSRRGYWEITIPLRTGLRASCGAWIYGGDEVALVSVKLTQNEYTLLDKVVTNQIFSESKDKIYRSVVYQRALQLWPGGTIDDVAMRTLGPWAVAYYKCQKGKFGDKCCHGLWVMLSAYNPRLRPRVYKASLDPTGDEDVANPVPPNNKGGALSQPNQETRDAQRNGLGYQAEGAEYVNTHEGGGVDAEDAEIRANVQGRIIKAPHGIGVVGQSTDDTGRKQIVGVLSQPVSVEPNVYAQEVLNAMKAIEERIHKKQRPYAGSNEDAAKLKKFVHAATFGTKYAPFSSKKILDTLYKLVHSEIKSKKWTDARIGDAIEKLCREIDPKFKLQCAVKLEPMPEGKAPRLLIADQDAGQVMALMTIYTLETLIKQHFPEKGIKGMSKRDAIKRVMKACQVPKKQAKHQVTVFEGDGSAWDTTCSAGIRSLVENPIINHIGAHVNAFLYSSPSTWQDAHTEICSRDQLMLEYKKNKEFKKIVIDAIRRSGHRGTSCLNWWMNFTCWHCAIFEEPEHFLNPAHRRGVDVTGNARWLNSAFEGDDSFLVTSPKIEPGKELHTSILQFWERIGFNMKIELRSDRALFVGYYIGLDVNGPKFDEANDKWYMIPEIDRCFTRAGTSCSPSMIEAFKAGDRVKLMKLAGSAAISRAYEFAGLAPTVSNKFLAYALECDFEVTHDLRMRTNEEFDDRNELIDHIRALNAMQTHENDILVSTGFWASDSELNTFVDRVWDYDSLGDWEGFRDSLPESWRN